MLNQLRKLSLPVERRGAAARTVTSPTGETGATNLPNFWTTTAIGFVLVGLAVIV